MTLQLSFSKAARAELLDAAAWYESKRPLLGVEFIAEIDRCIALAAEQPQFYSVVYRGLRRILTKRFPYGIYFQVAAQRIVVVAVFHSSRDPAIWQRRV
jgi:plasmid stabilization system protein ParE